jgi:hypothetical protein
MAYPRTAMVLGAALVSFLTGVATSTPAQAARPAPTVIHVGQVTEQDIPPLPGSEPDTVVEPDVAVSPVNPDIAVAVSHDGRYPDGGAVSISYAWTRDGGRTWRHAPLPSLTKSTGGEWDRASDPVVAFGPDGTVYISVLLIDLHCPSASVGVSRSTDGGRTFSPPVLVHRSDSCTVSDDKNWLVVDTGRSSPHRGRLYQFWSMFLSDDLGNTTGSPQVLRWSDDRGQHWSETVTLTATDLHLQNSQPMIQPDGTIVDTYLNFGHDTGEEGPERPGTDATQSRPRVAAEPVGDLMVARVSRDGGRTWSREFTVTHEVGFGPDGVRCCLPSAVADPVTGRLYAAWESVQPELVELATSTDGEHWSQPVQVNRNDRTGLDHVNVDVSAYGGRVFVSYGTRDTTVENSRFVQQQLSTSYDAGAHFGQEISVGPLSDLRYAAVAGGIFPGDYIGSAATHGRVYMVWCVSSAPADPAATFHQVVFGATLSP